MIHVVLRQPWLLKRKITGTKPRFVNSKCKKIHYIKDCEDTLDENKKNFLEEYRAKKKINIGSKVSDFQETPIAPEALLSQEAASSKISTDAVFMADIHVNNFA